MYVLKDMCYSLIRRQADFELLAAVVTNAAALQAESLLRPMSQVRNDVVTLHLLESAMRLMQASKTLALAHRAFGVCCRRLLLRRAYFIVRIPPTGEINPVLERSAGGGESATACLRNGRRPASFILPRTRLCAFARRKHVRTRTHALSLQRCAYFTRKLSQLPAFQWAAWCTSTRNISWGAQRVLSLPESRSIRHEYCNRWTDFFSIWS